MSLSHPYNRTKIDWPKRYAEDKQRLEELLRDLPPKEARAIAYKHQYAYQKSPRGKAVRSNYLSTPKGKESRNKSVQKYNDKVKNDPILKELKALRNQKYRLKKAGQRAAALKE